MFCYQCEQTARGEGCGKSGVCGKLPDVAALQDLLVYALVGLGQAAWAANKAGIRDRAVDVFACEALFATITNVDFDPERLAPMIRRAVDLRDKVVGKLRAAGIPAEFSGDAAKLIPAGDIAGLVAQGEAQGIKSYPAADADILSLKHTLLYGIKGLSAYADHAQILGQEDETVYAFLHEALSALADEKLDLGAALGLVMKCGQVNLRTMELLDFANTGAYGHPTPVTVPLGPKMGKAILVSGHDLKDLEELLKQTQGKGINVYTHGEMLPAHGYPGLKKYGHLYGHYGTAWQNQAKEFAAFPGAILMTTNCIQKPVEAYKENIFTSGLVAWPGVTHIKGLDFAPVIEKALSLPGFAADEKGKSVMTGFAHNAVLGVADQVIAAVKDKKIRHFFLVAGCDGAKPGRNYYTEFVEKVPADCIVLTLACGKFRFFDKELGTIGGIPRLLDMGQCNDAYSAIQVAVALSKAFGVGVKDLPLS
ncbi:MAG: hydroxylamine reductase, partial [Spirochaetaceae bacterium]|nr:hydroxylamine reductase [Spirochaetaceae bacterium]